MATTRHGSSTFNVDKDGFLPGGPQFVTNKWIDRQCILLGLQSMTEEHYIAIGKLWQWYRRTVSEALFVRLIQKNTGLKLERIYQLFPSEPKGFSLMANVKFTAVMY